MNLSKQGICKLWSENVRRKRAGTTKPGVSYIEGIFKYGHKRIYLSTMWTANLQNVTGVQKSRHNTATVSQVYK